MESTDRLPERVRSYGRTWPDASDKREAPVAPARSARAATCRAPHWRAWLAHPSATRWIIVASLLLSAPSIITGLVLDDTFHAVALGDEPASAGAKRAPWDAFSFAKSPASVRRMIDDGVFPWWSDLEGRVSFFRPLTSLTHWLDHRLWSESPGLMHLHNALWYGLLLLVVARVYRRFSIGSGTAPALRVGASSSALFVGLALAIYALDDARAMAVGWVANRGALLALGCGFASLLAHDSWRTTGRKRWLAASLGIMAVGLLCAEAAVQAVGYLLAYALFVDTGTKRVRALSLAPHALLVLLWSAAYRGLGYGAARTDLYVDPGRDPLRFTELAAERLPLLLTSQFTAVSADFADMVKYIEPGWGRLLVPFAVFCTAGLVWLFAPLWKSSREARFWATGALLSTVPVCAVAPADRLLTATALGGSALVALLLLAIADRASALRSRARIYTAIVVCSVNLLAAPLRLPLQSYSLVYLGKYIEYADASIPSGPEIAGKTLVMLNPPTDEYGLFLPFHRQARGRTMPEHIRWLATADNDLHITRLDRFTLRIRPGHGFLPPGSLWTLRSPNERSTVGETLELSHVTYRITEVTADGRPAEVDVRFDAPLDSDEFVWLRWTNEEGYVPFAVPQPGEATHVAAVDLRGLLATL